VEITGKERVNADIYSNDHLKELSRGDGHGDKLGSLNSSRSKGIIGVHDSMDSTVDVCKDPPERRISPSDEATEQQDCRMMIPVKEDDRSLPQYQESSVSKFPNLAGNEQQLPQCMIPSLRRRVTDDTVHSSMRTRTPDVEGLSCELEEAYEGEDCQEGVPSYRRESEIVGFLVLHDSLSPKEEHYVRGCNRCHDLHVPSNHIHERSPFKDVFIHKQICPDVF
jgi:hypothetical protein